MAKSNPAVAGSKSQTKRHAKKIANKKKAMRYRKMEKREGKLPLKFNRENVDEAYALEDEGKGGAYGVKNALYEMKERIDMKKESGERKRHHRKVARIHALRMALNDRTNVQGQKRPLTLPREAIQNIYEYM